MKKFASLLIALALCMGLAVPAMAADYKSQTLFGGELTLDSATVEKKALSIDFFGDVETKEVTLVTIQSGSKATVTGDATALYYVITDSGYTVMDGTVFSFKPGEYNVDDWFDDQIGLEDGTAYGLSVETDDGSEYILILGGKTAPAQSAKPADSAKPAEPIVIPEGSVAYTVKAGDTLGFIATNFYGNNAQRNALYDANIEAFRATKGALKPGMVLAIPAVLNKAVRIPAPAAAEGEKLYTVKAGDTLGQIAAAEYGNMNEYKAIFERNADRLKNANTIYEGQVIVLPAK